MEENKNQFVEDLQVGDKIKSTFLVVKKVKRVDKNDKPFYDLELQDKTGKIPGKIWSDSIPNIKDFRKKDIVFIIGEVKNDYGKQIIIKNLKKIEAENIDYSEYDFKVRKADNELLDNLINDLLKTISSFKNEHLKQLLNDFFEDKEFLNNFKYSTAAIKNHHALEGGLLIHTMSMVKICDFLVNFYAKEINVKRINRDLLLCGAILHDIGKTVGYSIENFLDINDEENLISHISIGYGLVLEKINKIENFPKKLRQDILHIILSHHGQKEFGSPVEPQILEAIIVYNVDRLDADIDHYFTVVEESLETEVFQYSNYFRRKIYIKKNENNLENLDLAESNFENLEEVLHKDNKKDSGDKSQTSLSANIENIEQKHEYKENEKPKGFLQDKLL
jgi:3'-5' exoribonuclease